MKDLVAGADLRFSDRGARLLAGGAGEWRLFAVLPEAAESAAGGPAAGHARHAQPLTGLSPRELDVLRLLVLGQSDREIADTLFIGTRTVSTHVSNLLAKLDVANRAGAAAVAVRVGLA